MEETHVYQVEAGERSIAEESVQILDADVVKEGKS